MSLFHNTFVLQYLLFDARRIADSCNDVVSDSHQKIPLLRAINAHMKSRQGLRVI